MTSIKILIVEDEVLIAEDIKDYLLSFGYTDIYMVHNKHQALQAIEQLSPDLVFLDLHLQLPTDGIEIARDLDKRKNIPYIFITANADLLIVQAATHTNAAAYITKPFKETDLFAAIQIALKPIDTNDAKYLIVKDSYTTLRILHNDILFIQSNGNYIDIHTQKEKIVSRQSLDWAETNLPDHQFVRVHRFYIINIRLVQRTTARLVFINDTEIPISRTYASRLAGYLKK